jgi:hypothetical protein
MYVCVYIYTYLGNSETDTSPRPAPVAMPAHPSIPVASQSLKTIQAILASCGPKAPVQGNPLIDVDIYSSYPSNISNWRLPELCTTVHNGGIPLDLVNAVASTYPLCALASEDARYRAFLPMNQSSAPSSTTQKHGNDNLPLYGGSGSSSTLPLKKRIIFMQECVKPVPQELDFIEAAVLPSEYSLNIPKGIENNRTHFISETPLEMRRNALSNAKFYDGPYTSDIFIFKTLEILPPSL